MLPYINEARFFELVNACGATVEPAEDLKTMRVFTSACLSDILTDAKVSDGGSCIMSSGRRTGPHEDAGVRMLHGASLA